MNKADLIAFEKEVAARFERKEIPGPIHLSGGNEDQLIEIFQNIKPTDWVFSTWRSHYHALLHGIPEDKVMDQIMQGHSMNLMFPEHNFFTSAIVGGICPIAVGVAEALMRNKTNLARVWCFVGDMTATTGIYHESFNYVTGHHLPIKFIIEDNELSCNTPTKACWGIRYNDFDARRYSYTREWPHTGCGKWVNF